MLTASSYFISFRYLRPVVRHLLYLCCGVLMKMNSARPNAAMPIAIRPSIRSIFSSSFMSLILPLPQALPGLPISHFIIADSIHGKMIDLIFPYDYNNLETFIFCNYSAPPGKLMEYGRRACSPDGFRSFSRGRTSGEAALSAHNEERKAFRVWGAE